MIKVMKKMCLFGIEIQAFLIWYFVQNMHIAILLVKQLYDAD